MHKMHIHFAHIILRIIENTPKYNHAALSEPHNPDMLLRNCELTETFLPTDHLASSSCYDLWCEHIRLNTHEKIFLICDISRRNGKVTHSVNSHLDELLRHAIHRTNRNG